MHINMWHGSQVPTFYQVMRLPLSFNIFYRTLDKQYNVTYNSGI
jgi:hypothetical protein